MRTLPFRSGMFDFSHGVVGGISDHRLRSRALVTYLRNVNNLIFRPLRAASVRPGSQDITSASYTSARRYHSGLRYYGGTPKLFAASRDGGAAHLDLIDGSSITAQTIPGTFTLTDVLSHAMVNNVMVAAQRGAPDAPMFYAPTNPANTLLTCVLPTPGATPLTLGQAAGGNLTALATYYYRLRYVFTNGTSLTTTPQSITLTAGNQTVNVTTIPSSTRSDFIAWRLERTKANGAVTSSYFTIAQGTAVNWTDTASDGSLLDRVDEGVHQPVPSLSGVIAHRNRMFGWKSQSVYASQVPGDLENTGIFNFHPLSEYVFPSRDGDDIQLCVKQGDRLVVLKGGSIHALEGDEPESFRTVDIYHGAGAAGPRAADSAGGDIFIFTLQQGLVRLRGNTPDFQFGWVEVGHYLETITQSAASRVVVKNWRNQFILIAYAAPPSTTNNEVLVYDLRYGIWTHFTGWRARDIVEVIDNHLGASMLIFDETKPNVWKGMTGTKDEVASDGTGGVAIDLLLESPDLDEGDTTILKDFERGMVLVKTGQGNLVLTFTLDTGQQFSVPLSVSVGSARWAPATANPLRWAPGANANYKYKWAGQQVREFFFGIPLGTTSKRYRVKITAQMVNALTIAGFALDGRLLPERPYSPARR